MNTLLNTYIYNQFMANTSMYKQKTDKDISNKNALYKFWIKYLYTSKHFKKYFSKKKNSVIIQTLLVNCNLLKTMSIEQTKVTTVLKHDSNAFHRHGNKNKLRWFLYM